MCDSQVFIVAFNPLVVILKENKLDGTNYIDWKRNLDIVFTAEDYKFVLTDLCQPKPHEGATEQKAKPYEKLVKADEMSWCYILASMSNILQHQHQSMPTAYDMMMNLKEMFGDHTRSSRHKAMKDMMNTTMAETTLVRDHVLKMIGLLNELEILGAEIYRESQVDIILQSLPNSYKQFFLNYNMNKP